MTYAAALAAAACFAIAFERLRISSVARRVIRSGLDASRVMRDSTVDDDQKERIVRAAALELLRSFGTIVLRSAAALAAALIPPVTLHLAGIVSLSAVNRILMSWHGILLASGTIALVFFVRTRL